MASEGHRSRARILPRILTTLGGLVVSGIVVVSVVIVAQMSGCCGGAPTHACKFVESHDAAVDSSSDAMLPCGFQICEPGVTTCCLEADSEPPLHCVPLGGICKGPVASCSGDQDCQSVPGQHCCGSVATMMVQCQAQCSGDYNKDQTVRVCRSDQECPAELPKCSSVTISGLLLYICGVGT